MKKNFVLLTVALIATSVFAAGKADIDENEYSWADYESDCNFASWWMYNFQEEDYPTYEGYKKALKEGQCRPQAYILQDYEVAEAEKLVQQF